MRRARVALAAAGVAALALAIAIAGSEGADPASAVVAALGNDYFLIAAFGAAALALAAPILASGRAANLRQYEMPTPERPTSAAAAGAGFDEACRRWRLHVPVYGVEARERLRARLLTAAVETERRRADCDLETARERVRDGDWGDDGVAAAFLAGERTPPSVWIAALAAGEPPFGRAARRTAETVVRRNGGP
jgi:hypothetical protein